MRTNILRVLALCALVALSAALSSGSAAAQDIQLASTAEMNNVYARLAELESRLAATNVAYSGGSCNGGGDSCDDCCRAGLIVGGEVVEMKSYEGDGAFGDFNFDEGFRFWVGFQRADGLGIRFRYFDFDQTADNGDLFDVKHADVEFYDSVQIGCNWNVIVGGGIRYLDVTMDNGNNAFEMTGVGPVLTAELYRHISNRAALYAIGRESIIVGNGRDLDNDNILLEDTTLMISEIQLGVQVHRDWNGALLFARLGWEAQYYHDISDGNETPVTLMGAVLSGGIMR